MDISQKKRRLSQNLAASANKLRFDTINKILKIDSSKGKKHKKEILSKQVSRVLLIDLMKNSQTIDLPDFKNFLTDENSVDEFRRFLKTQYCDENINFYMACEKYRNLDSDNVGREFVKFMANQIYNTYLSEGATQRVNIDHNCLQNIKGSMKNPDCNLFNDAQTEIFNLMKDDCFRRFCKTWQLDRKTANKILSDRISNFNPSSSTRTEESNSTITTSSHEYCDSTILSTRSTNYDRSLNLTSAKDRSGSLFNSTNTSLAGTSSRHNLSRINLCCPKDCSYLNLGLPCEHHNKSLLGALATNGTRSRALVDDDLDDKLNLKLIHQVPSVCKKFRSPPAPPLPPKPKLTEKPLSPELIPIPEMLPPVGKRLRPYLGKVFNV